MKVYKCDKRKTACINIKLRVNYGKLQALKNISLSIRKGLLRIIGSNGAGKSNLLKAIMGLASYEGSINLLAGSKEA